jgi:hypothetical protein
MTFVIKENETSSLLTLKRLKWFLGKLLFFCHTLFSLFNDLYTITVII